jgi:pimeloyl-ACP methyl ester carboxylesterase
MDVTQLRDDDGEHAALHDLGGDGPALLLTHGNGLNVGMWATVVPHLRATFHCFGLDFRGHGVSWQAHARVPVERHWFTVEVLAALEIIGGMPTLRRVDRREDGGRGHPRRVGRGHHHRQGDA